MRPVLPKISYEKVLVKDDLTKAQRLFIQYITNQKILNEIVQLRENSSINPFGFTEINELKEWRKLYPNQTDFSQVYGGVKRLIKEHQLPFHFNLALLDYVLFGFRVQLFFNELQQKKFLCILAEDVNISLKEYVGPRPFKTIIVFDGASEKDIIKSIRGRFCADKNTRVRGADKHGRDVMVRYYKAKDVNQLRKILDDNEVEYAPGTRKPTLVTKVIKAKHNRTVKENTVVKTRLDA